MQLFWLRIGVLSLVFYFVARTTYGIIHDVACLPVVCWSPVIVIQIRSIIILWYAVILSSCGINVYLCVSSKVNAWLVAACIFSKLRISIHLFRCSVSDDKSCIFLFFGWLQLDADITASHIFKSLLNYFSCASRHLLTSILHNTTMLVLCSEITALAWISS